MLPSGHRPLSSDRHRTSKSGTARSVPAGTGRRSRAPPAQDLLCSGLRLDLYHLGVGLPDGKLVATNGDLDRIAERRCLTHMKGRSLRDTHIHDSSLDGTLAGDLRYDAVLTRLNLS